MTGSTVENLPEPVATDASAIGGAEVFSSLLGSFREQRYEEGYAEGYQRAIADVLAAALVGTEEFLSIESERTNSDPRQLLYRFNRFLERRVLSNREDGAVVSDGLGI
jgi:hypothetical protein